MNYKGMYFKKLIVVRIGGNTALQSPFSDNVLLFRAAVFNREEIISFLLDHGVPVDTRDAQSTTPFLDAVTTGQTASAKLLLQKGANIRANNIYMKHCIHLSVENEHLQTLRMLLQEPLALWNLYRPDVYERVPLHYAAMVNDIRVRQGRPIINPISPSIKLHILLLCFHTFLTGVVGRSC